MGLTGTAEGSLFDEELTFPELLSVSDIDDRNGERRHTVIRKFPTSPIYDVFLIVAQFELVVLVEILHKVS
jgi:hypothetical protein